MLFTPILIPGSGTDAWFSQKGIYKSLHSPKLQWGGLNDHYTAKIITTKHLHYMWILVPGERLWNCLWQTTTSARVVTQTPARLCKHTRQCFYTFPTSLHLLNTTYTIPKITRIYNINIQDNMNRKLPGSFCCRKSNYRTSCHAIICNNTCHSTTLLKEEINSQAGLRFKHNSMSN